jgi:cytochrome P450
VQRVLVDNNKNYDKQTRGYDALRVFLGNGLLTSEGDFWRRQRRIAQPAFHRDRIAAFADTMTVATQEMLSRWQAHALADRPLDIAEEMTALTLRIVARTLLSADVGEGDLAIGPSVARLNGYARDAMTSPFMVPLVVPTPRNLSFRRHAAAIDKVVLGIIAERRKTGVDQGDLLSMLMDAQDAETGERMTDRQLRDEIMTIFLAGHETTASTLAWTLWLLSLHPDVMRRVQAELARELGGRAPALGDLPRLPFLQQTVKEAMRLFPPAWAIGRRAIEDDVVGDYRVPAGALVMVSPWVTHRHPALWSNPEGFDPDRFAPEHERARPKYAYFPFGGGPRLCIGNNFAMMEAEIVLANLLQRFSPALVPGHPVEPDPMVTLRPRHGIRMHLHPTRPIG